MTNKLLRKVKRFSPALLVLSIAPGLCMATPMLNHIVEPQDNIFNTDWGHAYNQVFDQTNQAHLDNPLPYGLAAGDDARSVAHAGSAFNFAGYDSVDITASGWIQDKIIFWTDVSGEPDFLFRGAPAYSLIGIWSLDPEDIVPALGVDSILAIGAGLTLDIPDGDALYLFLGENDGWFFDNGERRIADDGEWENFYNVDLRLNDPNAATVPEPSVPALLAISAIGLRLRKRQ